MTEQERWTRRNWMKTAAALVLSGPALHAAAAAGQSATAPSDTLPTARGGSKTSFAPLKQVAAGDLNIAYVEVGPSNGRPVLLLHGWPYDIHSYVDVAPALASAGYRVLIPYLRGYGATRFLSDATPRNGQQAALAVDALEFLNALKIETALVAGYDWGARTACILAALWPERCKGLVSVTAT